MRIRAGWLDALDGNFQTLEKISCFWVKKTCFWVKKPSSRVKNFRKSLETGVSKLLELTEIRNLFYSKLSKNDVKLEL
jgi:hypothetical protein